MARASSEPERNIEARVVRWADQHAVLHTKLNVMLRRGLPDDIFWIPGGRPALLEFKRRGKKPTPLQAYTIKKLKALGYDVCWFDNSEKAIRYLEARCEAAGT